MGKKLGVLIVGTGWVSTEHIRAFSMNEHTEVVAIVSRSAEKGAACAKRCNVPNAKIYTDYDLSLIHI